MKNTRLPYNSDLKNLARKLRKESTLSEILLWQKLKKKTLGVEFHRQVPVLDYIVDFYCHELKLVIEIDGSTHDNEIQLEKDEVRQRRIEQLGITFLRFQDITVKREMETVLVCILNKVAELNATSPVRHEPDTPFKGGL